MFFSPFYRFISDKPRAFSVDLSRNRSGFDSDLFNDSGIRVISDHAESDTTRPRLRTLTEGERDGERLTERERRREIDGETEGESSGGEREYRRSDGDDGATATAEPSVGDGGSGGEVSICFFRLFLVL